MLANTLCDFGGLKRWEGRSGALIRALSHCLVWWGMGALPGGALRRWLGAQRGAQPAWRLVVLVSAHLPAPSSALGLRAPTERQEVLLWPGSRVRRGRGST